MHVCTGGYWFLIINLLCTIRRILSYNWIITPTTKYNYIELSVTARYKEDEEALSLMQVR